ncbi:hypothetical protein D3C71_1519010 [compost metagenome]
MEHWKVLLVHEAQCDQVEGTHENGLHTLLRDVSRSICGIFWTLFPAESGLQQVFASAGLLKHSEMIVPATSAGVI